MCISCSGKGYLSFYIWPAYCGDTNSEYNIILTSGGKVYVLCVGTVLQTTTCTQQFLQHDNKIFRELSKAYFVWRQNYCSLNIPHCVGTPDLFFTGYELYWCGAYFRATIRWNII